jgi:coenzyme PQQ precursor peptide PqqA
MNCQRTVPFAPGERSGSGLFRYDDLMALAPVRLDKTAPWTDCHIVWASKAARAVSGNQLRMTIMKWHTPRVSEVCIGLEINDYLPAEL